MAGKIDVKSGDPYRGEGGQFGTSPGQKLADSFKALQGKTFIPKGNGGNADLVKSKKKEAEDKLAALRGNVAPDKISTIDDAKSYIAGIKKGDYTPEEQDAMKSYIGGDYKELNDYMRHQTLPPEDNVSEVRKAASDKRIQAIKDKTSTLSAMIDKQTLPEDRDLYRAANTKGLKMGSTFTDDGFVSTSLHTTAPSRISKNGQLLRIKAAKGTAGMFPAQAVDVNDDEVEFIIKPATTFKVTNVTEEDITLDTGKTKKFKILEVTIQ